jgi:exodeoxyribonuclease V beta subunit
VLDAAIEEEDAEELRLAYVALTRAQSQVVAWWGRSRDAAQGGLTRLLLGRGPGDHDVPRRLPIDFDDAQARDRLRRWHEAGAIALEIVGENLAAAPIPPPTPPRLAIRTFDRSVDVDWRRTSYSGLIRGDEHLVGGASSEPEVTGKDDEGGPDPDLLPRIDAPEESPTSPMDELPAGAAFGSLVHGVLELADPQASDLAAEITRHVSEQRDYWGIDVDAEVLAAGLLPMQLTPLGPVADDLRLVDIGRRDRLCELDFEFPMAGGDRGHDNAVVRLADFAGVLDRHLPPEDPLAGYAEQLRQPGLGDQVLRGYLSGSIDVVLRIPDRDGSRFVVVDYKTNRLGERDRPLTAWDYRRSAMAEAMMHSHYPLQALLYSVVLHRFLRWRLPDYRPELHLGGILYLFVRGMCGPQTPSYDGDPAGVFSWRPPAAMIEELSDLLDGRVGGAR